MLKEFQAFIMRGNVMDLAVGVIIGAAFSGIVDSLVKDVIMPPIGLLLGGIDFSNLFLVLKGEGVFNTLKATQEAGAVTINYGIFINAVVKFIIVGFAIFMMIKGLNKLTECFKKEEAAAPAAPSSTDKLLMEIRDSLRE